MPLLVSQLWSPGLKMQPLPGAPRGHSSEASIHRKRLGGGMRDPVLLHSSSGMISAVASSFLIPSFAK